MQMMPFLSDVTQVKCHPQIWYKVLIEFESFLIILLFLAQVHVRLYNAMLHSYMQALASFKEM